MKNLIRIHYGLVLIGFFLPFLMVQCISERKAETMGSADTLKVEKDTIPVVMPPDTLTISKHDSAKTILQIDSIEIDCGNEPDAYRKKNVFQKFGNFLLSPDGKSYSGIAFVCHFLSGHKMHDTVQGYIFYNSTAFSFIIFCISFFIRKKIIRAMLLTTGLLFFSLFTVYYFADIVFVKVMYGYWLTGIFYSLLVLLSWFSLKHKQLN